MPILWLLTAALLTVCLPLTVRADTASEREYKLKAAFMYNFFAFVDGNRFDQLDGEGSEEEPLDPNQPIEIGIVGDDPFGEAFAPLQGKLIKGRNVVVKRFKGYSQTVDANDPNAPPHPKLDEIRQCYVLFLCPSEKDYVPVILKSLGIRSILTVADTPGFLEAGGMINFVIEKQKVRFEINTAATVRARLRVRSRLLRLARRVITRDSLSAADRKEGEASDG